MAKKREHKPIGFSYYLEDEKLIEFSRWSIKEKLNWLEEINEFMGMVQTKKAAKIRKMFKESVQLSVSNNQF